MKPSPAPDFPPVNDNGSGTPPKKDQLKKILQVAKAARQGNLSVRFPVEEEGMASEISEVLNDIFELNENMINEFARVITAVAKGDLSQKMPLEIEGRPLKGEYLRIGTIVNSMLDQLRFFSSEVSRVAKDEEKYKQLAQELNRSNKELEEFAYVASHDLREPLHVVASFAYLLEKRLATKMDERETEYLNYIKEAVQNAQVLIKEVLEYSRIGKEKSFAMIDLSSVLSEVLTNLKAAIEESGVDIQYESLPKIIGNHIEIAQLFQNLISNAIKYRSDKTPKINIAVRSEDALWIFSIKDNGIGIDPEFHERIFAMFQRLHVQSEYSGAGVGLAICKKIVEHHGGKIWVESQIDQGATFYFSIKKGV